MKDLKTTATKGDENIWEDDSVEIFLDPGHSHQSYYHVGLTAAKVRATWRYAAPPSAGGKTEVVMRPWQSAVVRLKDRWTAEFAFPLAEFGLKDPCFGMSITRNAPAHGKQMCWTALPSGSFHQPAAFADVYRSGATSIIREAQLGYLAAGENLARFLVAEQPGAAPVTVALTAPDGVEQKLAVVKRVGERGLTAWEAPYTLGAKLGTWQFTVRAGDVPLGRYEGDYEATFFTAFPAKAFHRAGVGDPLSARVRMFTPPGAPLKGFRLRVRCLRDGRTVKETEISPLPGSTFDARFGISDLATGTYDLEFALIGPTGDRLKRTISEFEILPPFDR